MVLIAHCKLTLVGLLIGNTLRLYTLNVRRFHDAQRTIIYGRERMFLMCMWALCLSMCMITEKVLDGFHDSWHVGRYCFC